MCSQLPEGVPAELTVSELEEMACRQQQQIESQRQLLAAKEQRLRFLKQHEAKHQLVATEQERLRRLRDKVETQEQKLRKLRALRGQVDQTKLNNVSLSKCTLSNLSTCAVWLPLEHHSQRPLALRGVDLCAESRADCCFSYRVGEGYIGAGSV